MTRLVLGLDIGITSVGYGVIDIDENRFVDYGVRLFKEGNASDNETRRSKRGSRRLKRRKANRINEMKKLLSDNGLMVENYQPLDNPYEIRKKGLSEKLTSDQLVTAILHITKNRGTCLESNADESSDEQSTKSILAANDKDLKDKYICQIQLERLANNGKIRGSNNNFKTEDYLKELSAILNNQDLSSKLKEEILSIVARRRRYDQGPGSEKSPTPYGSYRLQDGKLMQVNLIDIMRGKCSVYPDEPRAPKQSYTAELFNLLNDLNNLKVKGEKLSKSDKQEIIRFVDEKGNITIKQLFKLLGSDETEISGFRIDKNNKPLLTEFKGYKKVFNVFKKHGQLDLLENKQMVDEIMDINTKAKGIDERKDKISKSYSQLDENLLNDLASIKGVSGYHSLSFKAMHLIIDEMMETDMNQMQILHQLEMFDKNRKSTKGQANIMPDDNAILSPVAKRAHRETFKVINKLRSIYGEFDSIVIETTRDKNTQEQKKELTILKRILKNNEKKLMLY